MRTTIYIQDELLRLAKQEAAKSGTTFTALVEDALRAALMRRKPTTTTAEKINLPTFRGRGVRPGINLDSNAELLDAMGEEP